MLHRRIAADHHVDDIPGRGGHGLAEVMGQRIERGDRGFAQFVAAAGLGHGVVDPADHVRAPRHLRILDGQAGQAPAASQVDQESRHIGGAQVDGQAQAGARGGGHTDQFALPQARAQRP